MFDLSPNHKGPTSDDEMMATIWTNAAITNHIPNYADLLEGIAERATVWHVLERSIIFIGCGHDSAG